MRGENMEGLLFWKNIYFEVGVEVSQRGLLSKTKGMVILCGGLKMEKAWEPALDGCGNQQLIVMGTNRE